MLSAQKKCRKINIKKGSSFALKSMIEVVGVRFREVGKIYYFNPNNKEISKGSKVIVETSRGIECGTVVVPKKQVKDDEVVQPLKDVLRVATPADLKKLETNAENEAKALRICEEKVKKYNLDMLLTSAECTFDGSKIIFYFTSDGRVDFRELVKDLASTLRRRIELRQIGVRDESKMIGGLGACGRPICCATFLDGFSPVSIKMAKEQGLSLNPTKISGTCGRLMCCLNYEEKAYEHLNKITPKVGAIVKTQDGKGEVIEVNILRGIIKVKLENRPEALPRIYSRDEVKLIKDGQVKLSKEEIENLKDIEN